MRFLFPLMLVVLIPCWCGLPAMGQQYRDHYPLQVGSQWTYRVTQVREPQVKEEPGKVPFEKVIITVEKLEDLPLKDLGKDEQETVVQDKDKKPVLVRSARLKVESGQKTLYENVALRADGVHRLRAADKDIVPPLIFFKFDWSKSWTVSCRSEGKKMHGKIGRASCRERV